MSTVWVFHNDNGEVLGVCTSDRSASRNMSALAESLGAEEEIEECKDVEGRRRFKFTHEFDTHMATEFEVHE